MDTINPMLVTGYDGGAYMVNHVIYDKLVQADSNGDPAPDLADSWEWKDPQTVVFNLVHNATWHDGVPFTAADAEFTIGMILALQSGEIHATGPILPPTVVPLMTSNPGIQVVSRPDLRYYYLNFNAFEKGTGNPTLRDERVRKALAYAVDKATLAQTVWQGFADVLNSIMPTALGRWHNPNTPDIPFDLDTAAKMLDDAGYKVGPDGIRVSPDGVKMIYKIQVPSSYQEELRAAQLVADWWGRINVKGEPELVEVGALGDIVVNWKHDTFIWVWSATSTDPDDFLRVFTTKEICVPGCLNDSGFSVPEYDQLYEEQIRATDPAQRQEIVWKMQDIVAEHVPYVPLYNNYAIQGFRADLFTGLPQGIVPPVSQFAGNNLFVNVRPIGPVTTETTQMTTAVTTTTPQAEAISTTTIAAVIVLVIVLVLVGVLLARRRKPAP